MKTIEVRSSQREQWIPLTAQVQAAVAEAGLRRGACLVYVPHTTAAVTINENADPDVGHDLLMGLGKIVPRNWPFEHGEGNSDAHLKSSLVGCSVLVPVENGRLQLGTWQGIFFGEFDGPRRRQCWIQFLQGVQEHG
ncbi:MAG: secondary thiamine-phosphate synthase enzyme YjbQ [Candidatus Sumerlaeia bacterium]|nr:secondary thiamine-phosphate synthase enzyme YjbQ [Candidatus Sumerlaeia bacterium]